MDKNRGYKAYNKFVSDNGIYSNINEYKNCYKLNVWRKEELNKPKTSLVADKFGERKSKTWNDVKSENGNNIPKEDWNQYKNEKLALELGKKAGQAGVKAALFASGVGIISKLYKGEEIEADEVVKTALETGADTGIKAAAGGALTVASKKKIINIFPEGTLPSTIAKVACVAVEDAKIMLKVAKGEFTMTEALDKMNKMEEFNNVLKESANIIESYIEEKV